MIIFFAIFITVAIILARLIYLQIINTNKYQLLSDKNRIRMEIILPIRAKILDRNGVELAINKHIHHIVMRADRISKFNANLEKISQLIEIKNKNELIQINQKMPRNTKITIKENLTWDEYSKLLINWEKLSDIFIVDENIRTYLFPYETSHILGYISANESSNVCEKHGKIGIEKFFEDSLFGQIGKKYYEVNSLGQKIRILDEIDAVKGQDLMLSIDINLQKYVYQLILEKEVGCAVVLDLENGEILSMVSVPSYDNNIFSSPIASDVWGEIMQNKFRPLNNRVINNAYPLGSIFKLVVAYAALDLNLLNEDAQIFCGGGYKYGTSIFHCWNRYGHGKLNLTKALQQSCDCFFYETAQKIGIDDLNYYARLFGFGSFCDIEILEQNSGLVPSRDWKWIKYQSDWKTYETILMGIGQGPLLVNVFQMMIMINKIANGNNFTYPTLVLKNKEKNAYYLNYKNDEAENNDEGNKASNKIKANANDDEENFDNIKLNEQHLKTIRNAMYETCNLPYGTAYKSCRASYEIAGKTSTIQVVNLKKANKTWEMRDHAMFVAYAPYKKPKYAICVFIEHGGGGASVTAPITRKIFDYLLTEKEKSVEEKKV